MIVFENHFHAKGIEGQVLLKTKVEGRQGKRYGTKRQNIGLENRCYLRSLHSVHEGE